MGAGRSSSSCFGPSDLVLPSASEMLPALPARSPLMAPPHPSPKRSACSPKRTLQLRDPHESPCGGGGGREQAVGIPHVPGPAHTLPVLRTQDWGQVLSRGPCSKRVTFYLSGSHQPRVAIYVSSIYFKHQAPPVTLAAGQVFHSHGRLVATVLDNAGASRTSPFSKQVLLDAALRGGRPRTLRMTCFGATQRVVNGTGMGPIFLASKASLLPEAGIHWPPPGPRTRRIVRLEG